MKNIKNIVWILMNRQHAEAVGYMGNKAVHTPNFDMLAVKSQIFADVSLPLVIGHFFGCLGLGFDS